MNFTKTLMVGAKAIIGSIVASVIMWLIMILGSFIAGLTIMTLWASRPTLGWVLLMVGLLVNVYVLGWIYNTFWGWK